MQPHAPRTGVVVPPELAVGGLVQVWAEVVPDHGVPISTFTRYSAARDAWAAAEQLDTPTSCRLLPGGAPWSVTAPGGPDRLASLGLSTTDLPALRAAAQERVAASDPATRRRV